MPYKDLKLALCTSQQVTAAATSETTIDTGSTYPPWDEGTPLAVVLTPEAKATAGTGYSISFLHKVSTGPTTTVILVTWVLLAAQLVVGKELVLPLPQGITLDRYMALYFSRTGGTEDYTFSAYLTPYPATGK